MPPDGGVAMAINEARTSSLPAVVARRLGLMSMLLLFAACTDAATPTTRVDNVDVTVRTASIVAPDSIGPGWRSLRVTEAEGEHIMVAFRLPSNLDMPTFLAALDTAPATPSPAIAIGGPEVGQTGEVVVHFTPGTYVLACVRRDDDGHRHAARGEARVLHVRAATAADSAFVATPPSTLTLRLADFAYVGAEQWAAGKQWLRLENTGQQDHQLRLARLRPGATLRDWMTADNPDSIATAVVGMARVGPGEAAYLPLDLAPGSYVAYCLVADAATRRQHVEMGMMRAIEVR